MSSFMQSQRRKDQKESLECKTTPYLDCQFILQNPTIYRIPSSSHYLITTSTSRPHEKIYFTHSSPESLIDLTVNFSLNLHLSPWFSTSIKLLPSRNISRVVYVFGLTISSLGNSFPFLLSYRSRFTRLPYGNTLLHFFHYRVFLSLFSLTLPPHLQGQFITIIQITLHLNVTSSVIKYIIE